MMILRPYHDLMEDTQIEFRRTEAVFFNKKLSARDK